MSIIQRVIDSSIRLIYELKLTIPQLRVFADYLGVNLKGCLYLKSEIVKWIVKGSLGAELRAKRMRRIIENRRQKMFKEESVKRWESFEAELQVLVDRVRYERDYARFFDANDKHNIYLLLDALAKAHRTSESAIRSLRITL